MAKRVATDAFGNALGESLARTNWSGNGEQSGIVGNSSAGGNLLSTINQDAFAENYPAMSLTVEGYARRDQMEAAGLIPSNSIPQMSLAATGWNGGQYASEQAFVQRDIGYDYQTNVTTADGGMSSVVSRVAHISPDDRLGFLQDDVHGFVTEIDDIASAGGSSWGTRAYAAATYGVRKITGDTISGLIGLPRLATSNTMLPSIINAAANPLQAGRSLLNNFSNMSLQDKLVTGLEAGLPFKGSIENLAGRIPGLSYDVGAAGARGLYSMGQYTAGKIETMLDRSGLQMYAVPPSPTVIANKAAGDAWELDVINNVLPSTQANIQPQITVRSNGPSGLKVRLDALGEDIQTGTTMLSDMKASAKAPHTPNQSIVYPELEIYGGVVVGKGKAPYVGGTKIPPSVVDIIRKR